MPLYDSIARGREQYPDRLAIVYRDTRLTYGALADQVDRCAAALRALGVGTGGRVAILLPNCPPFTITYYGATALGAMCVPANPLLKAPELVHIWGDSECEVVVTASPLLAAAREAAASLPRLRHVVSIGPEPAGEGVLSFAELLGTTSPRPIDPSGIAENDPAVCIYTSGTTGRPKGALLSHRNLLSNCDQCRRFLRFDGSDNFLCVLPLFHSFAGTVCQNTALYCGARITLMEQFHPARALDTIATERVTIVAGVPAMFAAMLQLPPDMERDLSSVRVAVSGGAPMPVPVLEAFEKRFGVPIIEGDGPTECSPVTSVNPLDGVRKPGSIGVPLPGVEMRIFDDQDNEVPVGAVGEIVVRGPNVMLGYLNQPEATAEAMRSGWYHTGDLGTMDEDGYFRIVDRKKDMLIVGGINVYPREVEEVLYAHPSVADAAVIGAHDPLRGEQVVAVVVLKPDATATERELIGFCRQRLANYKVPRKIVFRDQMPRSDTGKILKRLLRKEMDLGPA